MGSRTSSAKLVIVIGFALLYFSSMNPTYRKSTNEIRNILNQRPKPKDFVIMTATTWSYRFFSVNMACSLGKETPVLFIALDRKVLEWLRDLGHNAILASDGNQESDNGKDSAESFGTKQFNLVTQRKISAVRSVTELGLDVLYADGDIFWCDENAIGEILEVAKGADIVMQRTNTAHVPINSGLYYAHASNTVNKLLYELESRSNAEVDDQVLFNRVLCNKKEGTALRDYSYKRPRLLGCRSKNGTHLSFLSEDRFPIGCTRLKGRRRHVIEEDPDLLKEMCRQRKFGAFHFSCVEAQSKVEEMKKRNMWIVNSDGRCISK